MLETRIIEFSLQTQAEFARPCIKDDANLIGLTRQVSEAFGEFLDCQDVVLNSTDELFGYTLTLPMFRGSGEIVLNAQSITVAFRNGRNGQELNFVTTATCKLLGLATGREMRQYRISFTCVANFKSPEESDAFIKRLANPEKGITSGGVISFATGGKVAGELRLSIEKALGFDHAVFIYANIATTDSVTEASLANLQERLIELLQFHGLKLVLSS